MNSNRPSSGDVAALALPPRDEARRYFLSLVDHQPFVNSLVDALWDAHEKADVSPLQEFVRSWHTVGALQSERTKSAGGDAVAIRDEAHLRELLGLG